MRVLFLALYWWPQPQVCESVGCERECELSHHRLPAGPGLVFSRRTWFTDFPSLNWSPPSRTQRNQNLVRFQFPIFSFIHVFTQQIFVKVYCVPNTLLGSEDKSHTLVNSSRPEPRDFYASAFPCIKWVAGTDVCERLLFWSPDDSGEVCKYLCPQVQQRPWRERRRESFCSQTEDIKVPPLLSLAAPFPTHPDSNRSKNYKR